MYSIFIKQLLILLFSLKVAHSLTNDARFGHASAIINDKLYIIGGQTQSIQSQDKGSNDMFYLDLTNSFNVRNPSWTDLTKTSSELPVMSLFGSVITLKDDGILLFEGYTWDLTTRKLDTGENSLYLFNTSTGQWTIPSVTGSLPSRRRGVKIVSNSAGDVFVFGGIQLFDPNPIWLIDMYMLDTSKFSWELLAQMKNAPTESRVGYTATLSPSGVIIYIGGKSRVMTDDGTSQEIDVNIGLLMMYDTKDNTWYLMVTKSDGIDNRSGHSAVLTNDGRILIYGGVKGLMSITAAPDLVLLDINNLIYKWSIPQVSSTTSQDRPPSLTLHTADLYGDYMIISFGNITNGETSPTQMNSNIYMLDTKNYIWINSYTSNSSTSSHHDSPQDNFGLILGIVSGVIAFAIIACIVGVLIYKKYKGRKSQIIYIPGSNAHGEHRVSVTTVDSNDDNRSMTTNHSMTDPLRQYTRTSLPPPPPPHTSSLGRPSNVPYNNNVGGIPFKW